MICHIVLLVHDMCMQVKLYSRFDYINLISVGTNYRIIRVESSAYISVFIAGHEYIISLMYRVTSGGTIIDPWCISDVASFGQLA